MMHLAVNHMILLMQLENLPDITFFSITPSMTGAFSDIDGDVTSSLTL